MTRALTYAMALTLPFAFAVPALAQDAAPPPGQTAPGTSSDAAPPMMAAPGTGTMAPGTGMSNGHAMSAAKLSKTDRSFVMKAAAGGEAEVQAAQIAQQKSQNDTVKAFAQKMIDDHTPNNKELMDIAMQKGMTPPATLPKKTQSQLDRLQGMDGTKFDQAYMKDQVKDHKMMLAGFKTEAMDGTDPDLKAFAQKTIPVIQSHLDMARADLSGGAKAGM